MTEKEAKLYKVLVAFNEHILNEKWREVVDAVNELSEDIDSGESHAINNCMFPVGLERAVDYMAKNTAWIYDRLERLPRKNSVPTANKIRSAMGYNS